MDSCKYLHITRLKPTNVCGTASWPAIALVKYIVVCQVLKYILVKYTAS